MPQNYYTFQSPSGKTYSMPWENPNPPTETELDDFVRRSDLPAPQQDIKETSYLDRLKGVYKSNLNKAYETGLQAVSTIAKEGPGFAEYLAAVEKSKLGAPSDIMNMGRQNAAQIHQNIAEANKIGGIEGSARKAAVPFDIMGLPVTQTADDVIKGDYGAATIHGLMALGGGYGLGRGIRGGIRTAADVAATYSDKVRTSSYPYQEGPKQIGPKFKEAAFNKRNTRISDARFIDDQPGPTIDMQPIAVEDITSPKPVGNDFPFTGPPVNDPIATGRGLPRYTGEPFVEPSARPKYETNLPDTVAPIPSGPNFYAGRAGIAKAKGDYQVDFGSPQITLPQVDASQPPTGEDYTPGLEQNQLTRVPPIVAAEYGTALGRPEQADANAELTPTVPPKPLTQTELLNAEIVKQQLEERAIKKAEANQKVLDLVEQLKASTAADKLAREGKKAEPLKPVESITAPATETKPRASDRWQAMVDELDANPDTRDYDYRDILSTGSRKELRKGETWRGRVLSYIKADRERGNEGPQFERTKNEENFANDYSELTKDAKGADNDDLIEDYKHLSKLSSEAIFNDDANTHQMAEEYLGVIESELKSRGLDVPERQFIATGDRDKNPNIAKSRLRTNQNASWTEAAGIAKELGIEPNNFRNVVDLVDEIERKTHKIFKETGINPLHKKPEGILHAKSERGGIKIGQNIKRAAGELTTGYSGKLEAIMVREGMQNAIDAVRHLDENGKIKIKFGKTGKKDPLNPNKDEEFIEISDNGKGMNRQQLETVFSDLNESGKTSESGATGGKGIGKATYMLGGAHFSAETVTVVNGRKILFSIKGTPDEFAEHVDVTETPVSDNTPTGTTIRTVLTPEQSGYYGRNMLDKIVRDTRGVKSKITIDRYNFVHSTEAERSFSPSTNDKVVYSANIDGNDVTVSIPHDAKLESRHSVDVSYLNNGMYQFHDDHYFGEKTDNMPDRLIVDIHPTAEEGTKEYPFPTQRETVKVGLRDTIGDAINKYLAHPQQQAKKSKLKELYENMVEIGHGTERKGVFFDPGDRMTVDEKHDFKNNLLTEDIIKHFDSTIDDILASTGISEWQDRVESTGIVLDPGMHGVHIPNPDTSESTILINPFSHTKNRLASPTDAAFNTIITMLHEVAHVGKENDEYPAKIPLSEITDPRIGKYLQSYLSQIQEQGGLEGHHMDWLKRLGEVFTRYGVENTFAAADKLEALITDEHGRYSREFQELLQIYNDSRRRDAVTEDYLSPTGVKQKDRGQGGEGDISGDSEADGERTTLDFGKGKERSELTNFRDNLLKDSKGRIPELKHQRRINDLLADKFHSLDRSDPRADAVLALLRGIQFPRTGLGQKAGNVNYSEKARELTELARTSTDTRINELVDNFLRTGEFEPEGLKAVASLITHGKFEGMPGSKTFDEMAKSYDDQITTKSGKDSVEMMKGIEKEVQNERKFTAPHHEFVVDEPVGVKGPKPVDPIESGYDRILKQGGATESAFQKVSKIGEPLTFDPIHKKLKAIAVETDLEKARATLARLNDEFAAAERSGNPDDIENIGQLQDEAIDRVAQLNHKANIEDKNAQIEKLNEHPPIIKMRDAEKYRTGKKLSFTDRLKDTLGDEQGSVPRGDRRKPSVSMRMDKTVGDNKRVKAREMTETEKAVYDIANVPQAIMASLDVSAPLRQGAGAIGNKAFWTSLGPMFKSFVSEDYYNKSNARIEAHPDHGLAVGSGVKFTDLKSLKNREEAYQSQLAEKLTTFGVLPERHSFVKMSGRAYTTFLNETRMGVFSELLNYTKDGRKNPGKAKAIADVVNNITGRGKLGPESWQIPLNAFLFSPRLMGSRVKMLNPYTYLNPKTPTVVRLQYMRSLGALIAAGALIGAVAKMFGADVVLDPNSSDFLKAKVGKQTRFELVPGGFGQYINTFNKVFMPRALGGGYKTSPITGRVTDLQSGKYGSPTQMGELLSFFRHKLKPLPALFVDIKLGTDFKNTPLQWDSPSIADNPILSKLTPISAQDATQMYQQENWRVWPLMAPALLGMGVQTYGDKPFRTHKKSGNLVRVPKIR